jgi:hypothetical protein
MIITGINVRICIMNLFNTGLNKLQFRVLKTLMYLYTPGVYGRSFMGGHPDRGLWEREGGEGGGSAVAIGFLLQGGLIASQPHTQRR